MESRISLIGLLMLPLCACTHRVDEYNFHLVERQCVNGDDADTCRPVEGPPQNFEVRLVPKDRRVIYRQIGADGSTASLSDVGDCIIWDENNWECTNTGDTFLSKYSMINGKYEHWVAISGRITFRYQGEHWGASYLDRLWHFVSS